MPNLPWEGGMEQHEHTKQMCERQ